MDSKLILPLFATVITMTACNMSTELPKVQEATEAQITRVEPLSWWVGMTTPLQLLVQGQGISGYDVAIYGGSGVKVREVSKADHPDFLFVDVEISTTSKPGTYWLVFTKGRDSFKVPYEIAARDKDSAGRGSFTTADLIYLINPDRFADGDPSIDTTADTKEGIHRKSPGGRHGGDIQGMIDHLDYMADLGVTAVWPTPLLEDNDSTYSYHGYACSDYYRIDPRYGTNELYRDFVAKAHEKGIKVLMDVVTNHCGLEHWWMKDMPFKDWIHVNEPYFTTNHNFSTLLDPNAAEADRRIMVDGWFVPSMPDINLANPFVLRYFQQWAVWWTEWAGLDGFRVDTYPYNDKEAAAAWCDAVLKEYPNLNIMGECWIHYHDQLAYWQRGENSDGFDTKLPTIMDFPLNDALNSALAVSAKGRGGDIYEVYQSLSHDFVYKDLSHLLIFFANHDCPRMGDVVRENPYKMKLALTLLATLRGIPQLYYGDEMMFSTGSQHRDDGKLRMDFPGGWEGDPVNLFTEEGREAAGTAKVDTSAHKAWAAFDWADAAELHDFTRTLFQWRKTSGAVCNGRTRHFIPEGNTYAYFRYTDAETVFVFVNNSDEPRNVQWSRYGEMTADLPATGHEVITGRDITLSDQTVIAPNSSIIVDFRK